MGRLLVPSGQGGTCRLDQLVQKEASAEQMVIIQNPGLASKHQSSPPQLQHELQPRLSPSPHRNVSIVESPFGPLALTIQDASSYCPNFPIFADDAGEQDVYVLLENGLEMLDGVQVSALLM